MPVSIQGPVSINGNGRIRGLRLRDFEDVAAVPSAGEFLTFDAEQEVWTAAPVEIPDSIPPGTVMYFPQATAPSGFLKANGAAISRTTYSSLFSAIGVAFGQGDGTTTFNIPDLRGEFIRGFDDGRKVDDKRVLGSFQDESFKSHSHNYTQGLSKGGGGAPANEPAFVFSRQINTGAVGGSETRPRNVALLACIKY